MPDLDRWTAPRKTIRQGRVEASSEFFLARSRDLALGLKAARHGHDSCQTGSVREMFTKSAQVQHPPELREHPRPLPAGPQDSATEGAGTAGVISRRRPIEEVIAEQQRGSWSSSSGRGGVALTAPAAPPDRMERAARLEPEGRICCRTPRACDQRINESTTWCARQMSLTALSSRRQWPQVRVAIVPAA